MARAPRVEYDGAQYHVMCRGDRCEPIFEDEDDHGIFLATLGQACERSGWLIHAYVLMRNHYHFLLETPGGNLVGGMQWFQTTYTARFNARHGLSGHLFQGRYKALLIDPEDSAYARRVADYIHLNPVRAKVVADEKTLADLRWCSYRHYVKPKEKPVWQEVERVYGDLGLSSSKVAERRRYRRYISDLIDLAVRDGGEEEGVGKLSVGWVLGGEDFVERMQEKVDSIVGKGRRESFSGPEVERHDDAAARKIAERALMALELDLDGVRALKKNDVRKQALAWVLKSRTMVSNAWICQELEMGHRSNLSRACRRIESSGARNIKSLKGKMLRCAD